MILPPYTIPPLGPLVDLHRLSHVRLLPTGRRVRAVSGEYAASFVRGFEHLPDDERYLAASACCKHYVANSMEDSRTVNIHHTRYSADPNITMQDLVDSYMAPFQACVEKGRVSR